jgi:hypothetical protein
VLLAGWLLLSTSIDGSLDCPASKVGVVGTEARYLSGKGHVLGLDIGPEIEMFDRLSISFALDGLAQAVCFLTLIFV